VVSQVYGGGGNTGSTLKNDFIEIFNAGNQTVNLSTWSVQYMTAAGTGTWSVTSLTGSIAPGRYYLVQEAAGGGGTTSLPPPDAPGTINLAASAGKVALVSSTTALNGACPTINVVDEVGYGSTATCFEGTSPAPAPGSNNLQSALRNSAGCTDTNQNASDFTAGTANPRNSATATNQCPGTLAPPDGDSQLVWFDVSAFVEGCDLKDYFAVEHYHITPRAKSEAAGQMCFAIGTETRTVRPDVIAGQIVCPRFPDSSVSQFRDSSAQPTGPAS
jgi:predicted extracellular nuclease